MIAHLESTGNRGKSLLFLFAFFCLTAAGQPPYNLPVNYYSVKDGLSYRMVTAITQDPRGFIWLGTPNGLNRFDGYEFLVFNDDDDADYPISESSVRELELFRDGRLFIRYDNNLIFFELLDPVTFQTERVGLLPQDGIKGLVRSITLDGNGEIYVLSLVKEGVNLYHYEGGSVFTPVAHLSELRKDLAADVRLVAAADGSFLINDSEYGLRRIKATEKDIHPYDLIPAGKSTSLPPGTATFLHQDRSGRIWYAQRGDAGLFLYDPESDRFNAFEGLSGKATVQAWEDLQGNMLFVQSDDPAFRPEAEAIYCLQPNGKLHNFNHILESNTRIVSLYSRDFFQEIFIGLGSGLMTLRNNRSRVLTYLAQPLRPDQQGVVMRGITESDQGDIYFAREYYHWYRLHPATQTLDTLLLFDQETGEEIDISCSMELAFDPQGYLWGFTCQNSDKGYLLRYDTLNCTTQVFPYSDRFSAMTITSDGDLWLTTANSASLIHFDPGQCQFSRFLDREGRNPLANTAPQYLIESRDGFLWVGTNKGLLQIDPNRKTTQLYLSDLSATDQPSLNVKTIFVIAESCDGKIWAGGNNGFCILDPVSGRTRHYNQDDGLASSIVCGFAEDEKGNFWISTFNGLTYFETQSEEFHNFFQIDGFSHDEFNRFSFHRAADRTYYFGGVNGLNAFRPEDLLIEKDNPSVSISKIVRYNSQREETVVQHAELADLRKIEVSPYDDYVEVHFMLPDYVLPFNNQFKVKLIGLDKQWSYLGNTPYIRYNRPPAGNYDLQVLAADPNGNWSATPLVISMQVDQVFYKRWWFGLLLLALTGALAYFLSLVRLRQKLRVEKLRTRLSSDLHDEVSGLLASIAMQSDVLQMMTQEERIQNRLRNIGEVSRKAMTKMSDVIWSIDSRKDRVEDLLQRMREHADDVLLPLNIRYHFDVQSIDYQRRIPVDIRQELFFIFKEAVNNIGKHSHATQVDIRFGNFNGAFEMVIKDNGTGQTTHSGRTGQGLTNLKMRAQRIKADLNITDQEGYTIKVGLPRFV